MGWLVSAGWVPAFLIIPLGDLEGKEWNDE